MTKAEKVKQVYDLLNLGCTIGIRGGWMRKHNKNICWVNYGASAVRCNLENLKWLINTIYGFKHRDFDYEILMF